MNSIVSSRTCDIMHKGTKRGNLFAQVPPRVLTVNVLNLSTLAAFLGQVAQSALHLNWLTTSRLPASKLTVGNSNSLQRTKRKMLSWNPSVTASWEEDRWSPVSTPVLCSRKSSHAAIIWTPSDSFTYRRTILVQNSCLRCWCSPIRDVYFCRRKRVAAQANHGPIPGTSNGRDGSETR
jgi:hypothetical protein